MADVLMHYFVKEEEFLDRHEVAATVAAWFLKGGSPDYRCDDAVRLRREQMLSAGMLDALVFSGAAVYYSAEGFSSVQIALRSATRSVNVRVRKVGREMVAEKLADRPVSVQHS
jgi:hypothetical protein